MIAWIDIETTGLDPEKDSVLELGVVVTDLDLVEKGWFHRVYLPQRACASNPDTWDLGDDVREMHERSGLLDAYRAHPNISKSYRPAPVCQAIRKIAPDWVGSWFLGGHNVHFDRSFLAFPPGFLSHRHYDVCSAALVLNMALPPSPHRALLDIYTTLEAARVIRDFMRHMGETEG